MQATECKIFSGFMASMGEIYAKELSSILIDIYWQCLKSFELNEVCQAFRAHLKNPDGGQFFPKPADLIRVLEGSSEGRALRAWSQVQCTMGRVGRYHSVAFDDRLIHAVIEDMGGWIAVCETSLKDLPFIALDFQKRYRALLNQNPKGHPRYLVGIIERENAKEGYDFGPPVLVGDPQKAQAVIASGSKQSLRLHHPSLESMKQLIEAISAVQQKRVPSDE
jgi:Domain of unknown function (DUF6475)